MFCKKCYANLNQAVNKRCARCGRMFDSADPRTYLPRAFPSRLRTLLHTVLILVLATGVSFVVSMFLAVAQVKYLRSNH